jgi:hypothetical protein
MSLWDTANKIEELSHDLSNVRDAIELIAENLESPHSGALWSVYTMIDNIQDRMYIQTEKVMDLHRAESKPKKAKK